MTKHTVQLLFTKWGLNIATVHDRHQYAFLVSQNSGSERHGQSVRKGGTNNEGNMA